MPRINDLTGFLNRSHAGTNMFGQGCLDGCHPCSMFNPMKKGGDGLPARVETFNVGDLMFEGEDGEYGWITDTRHGKELAKAGLFRLSGSVDNALSRMVQDAPMSLYCPPREYWIWPKTKPVDGGTYEDAITAWLTTFAKKRIRVAIDCHPFTQVSLTYWARYIRWLCARVKAVGLEYDLVWQMKWHQASQKLANQPLTYDDAKPMIEELLARDPRAIWLMGGEGAVLADYSDLGRIVQHLTTGKAA